MTVIPVVLGSAGGGIPTPKTYTMGAAQTRTMSQAIGLGQSHFGPAQGVFKISGDKYGLTTSWYNTLTEMIFTQMAFDSSGDITWGTDQNWYSTGQPIGVAGAGHDGNRVIFSGATNTTTPQQRYHTSFDLSAAGVLSNKVENGYTYNVYARDDNPHNIISLGDAFFIDFSGMTATNNEFRAGLYRVSDMASTVASLGASDLPDASGSNASVAINSDRSDNDSGFGMGLHWSTVTNRLDWYKMDYVTNPWGTMTLTSIAVAVTTTYSVDAFYSTPDMVMKYLGNDLFIGFTSGYILLCRHDGTTFTNLGSLATAWRRTGSFVYGGIISATATEIHGFLTCGSTNEELTQVELYAKPFVMFLNSVDQVGGFMGAEHHLTNGLTGNFTMPHVIVPDAAPTTATFIFLDANVASSVAFRKLTQA